MSTDPNLIAPLNSIHQFQTKTLEGKDFDMATLKGKKVLIVNTASHCGLTYQYRDLQALYDAYKDKNFILIGFPSNSFKNQESGNSKEIREFCEVHYGVTFPLMEKVEVTGNNMHPIYKWLTQKKLNGVKNTSVRWNFQKYLINEKGELVDYVNPWRSPKCRKIIKWLNK